jgi:hypothetical protein
VAQALPSIGSEVPKLGRRRPSAASGPQYFTERKTLSASSLFLRARDDTGNSIHYEKALNFNLFKRANYGTPPRLNDGLTIGPVLTAAKILSQWQDSQPVPKEDVTTCIAEEVREPTP